MDKKQILAIDSKKHVKIWLLHKLGMSRREIAEALGTNPGHVGNEIKAYEKNEDKRKAAEGIFGGTSNKPSKEQLKKIIDAAEEQMTKAVKAGDTKAVKKGNEFIGKLIDQYNDAPEVKTIETTSTESKTPLMDAYHSRIEALDKDTLYSDVSKLEVGDMVNLHRHPQKGGGQGFVKKIGPKNITIEMPYGGYGENDYIEIMEIKRGKDEVKEFLKPAKMGKKEEPKKESQIYQIIRKEAIAAEKENPEIDEEGLCAGNCAIISGDLKDRLYKNHKIESEWIDVGNNKLSSIYQSEHSALLLADKGLIIDTQVWQFTDHGGPKDTLKTRKIVFTFEEYDNLGFYWAVVKMGKGGILEGPKHGDGGIKAKSPNGPLEVEGGEIIINAKAAKEHCQELSEINQSAGGGVAFPCDHPALDGIQGPMNGKGAKLTYGGKIGAKNTGGVKWFTDEWGRERFEIDDSTIDLDLHFIIKTAQKNVLIRNDYQTSLKNILKSWDGYKHYPDMKDVLVVFRNDKKVDDYLYAYRENMDSIFINSNKIYNETVNQNREWEEDLRLRRVPQNDGGGENGAGQGDGSSLRSGASLLQEYTARFIHELQHPIQNREGIKVYESDAESVMAGLKKLNSKEHLSDFEFKNWVMESGWNYEDLASLYYNNIPSEKEALDVERRALYGKEKRESEPNRIQMKKAGYGTSIGAVAGMMGDGAKIEDDYNKKLKPNENENKEKDNIQKALFYISAGIESDKESQSRGIPNNKIAEGVEVEKEHTDLYNELSQRLGADGHKMPMSKDEFFRMIAAAHIKERGDYYPLLKKYVEHAPSLMDKPYYLLTKEEVIACRDFIEMREAAGIELTAKCQQRLKDLARYSMVKFNTLLINLK